MQPISTVTFVFPFVQTPRSVQTMVISNDHRLDTLRLLNYTKSIKIFRNRLTFLGENT